MSKFHFLCEQALGYLKQMEKENPAIKFSSLTYTDGRILATSLSDDMDKDTIACSETAMFFISSNLASHLFRGEIDKVLISGNNGVIVIQGIGHRSVLTTAIKKGASIKKIMSGIEKHLENLESIENSLETMLRQYYFPQDDMISSVKERKTSVPS
ncbi:MAG: hypothetical protein ACUVXA_13575 [Candidatus Jordarchaeum sp.]|uniref:hypothetical protein n=1 Tax=Candidatus Jordarchaeum sp. TaxID=2823881 RepID=UPI00404B2E75